MRALTVAAILAVVGAPMASALLAPRIDVDDAAIAPFPADITDAEVLLLLAHQMGLQATRLPIPIAPPDADLGALASALGARAGLELAQEDIDAFRALDPLVALPTATLILAMLQAWDLRDLAFADWTEEDYTSAEHALQLGLEPPKVLTPDQMESLLNAAILLSDTIESIVIPQLELAANAGVWPPIAIADPVGVLRIGSSGNDIETIDRILQIDARGDDVYRNNAGGAVIEISPRVVRPIAASIDLSGNDVYEREIPLPAQGAGRFGIGLLYDLRGDDRYHSLTDSTGSGKVGVGLLRDASGADRYRVDLFSLGSSAAGLGYLRDDAGDDIYHAGALAGGSGVTGGMGVFWDRGGIDEYGSRFGDTAMWGWAETDGKGWFVDETASTDTYVNLFNPSRPHPRACNTCIWSAGLTPGGRGNDNYGGLAYLIAKQAP